MKIKNPLLLIVLFTTLSCSNDIDFIDRMWIDSTKIEVEVWPVSGYCYNIQENELINEDDWRSLCQSIEGFDEQYQEGYIYKISVNKIKIENPPQDGSSVRYKLKEIISKELDE